MLPDARLQASLCVSKHGGHQLPQPSLGLALRGPDVWRALVPVLGAPVVLHQDKADELAVYNDVDINLTHPVDINPPALAPTNAVTVVQCRVVCISLLAVRC